MNGDSVRRPPLVWWIAILGGLTLNAWVGFSDSAYATWCALVTEALPQRLIRNIFLGAIVVHAAEALYVWRVARAAHLTSASAWARQTFLLGFPSLQRLRRELARR